MSVILKPEIPTVQQQEAAISRFFFYDRESAEPKDVFAFARGFSLRYGDLLPEAVGSVMQTGADEYGELVELDDPKKHTNLTLLFDAREATAAYAWQLTEAGAEGREIYRLEVKPDGYEVTRFSFDTQGRLQTEQSCGADENVAKRLQALARHDHLREEATKLRSSRAKLEMDLERFSVEAITRLSPHYYEQELARQENMIVNLGFVALKPIGG